MYWHLGKVNPHYLGLPLVSINFWFQLFFGFNYFLVSIIFFNECQFIIIIIFFWGGGGRAGINVFHGRNAGKVECDFGYAHGRHFLPTAMPRIQDAPNHLSALAFTTANPRHSTVLQTWPESMVKEIVVSQQNTNRHLCQNMSSMSLAPDLDPLIVEAYKAVMANSLEPSVMVLPDIPGKTPIFLSIALMFYFALL